MSDCPKRPTKSDYAVKIVAARCVAKRLIADCDFKGEIDDVAEQIAKNASVYDDGYENAKTIESRCYWECDFAIAEVLDSYGSELYAAEIAAEKIWFAENDIRPPLPIGARVILKRGETGVIDAISEYGSAKYCVIIDGDARAKPPTNSRRLVNFEDAAPEAAARASDVAEATEGFSR